MQCLKQFKTKNWEQGFTYIEAIIYIVIVSIMLTALIPFAWNIIEGGAQSSVQQEVSSNARYISERIKYEIRNASGITSVDCASAAKTITLTNSNASLSPTIITYTSPNITIKQGSGSTVNLNSNDVRITSFTCSNNTSGDTETKNISFAFTITQAYSGSRADFKYTTAVQSSAEIRSN